MKSGFAVHPDRVVARTLKLTRATFALVAAITAFMTMNVMITLQFLAGPGQATVFALLFASVAVVTSAIAIDILSRSSQAMANLRSLGAQRLGVASAIFFFLLAYNVLGTALGAGVGVSLESAITGASVLKLATLTRAAVTLLISALATVLGVYAGVRVAWRS